MLQPHKQKMWLTSHDDEFREKRDDVLRVYYETPPDEHIICVDEKTGIQALERMNPDIAMEPGQPIRREFEYIRHGTLCLMGACDVRRGKIFGFTANKRGGDAFVDLLDVVDTSYPSGNGHIVMDNLSDHNTVWTLQGFRVAYVEIRELEGELAKVVGLEDRRGSHVCSCGMRHRGTAAT